MCFWAKLALMEQLSNIVKNFSIISIDTKGNEKIIIKLNNRYEHYTIHLGTRSKTLDIHKTIESPNSKSYDTIFRVKHFTICRIILSFRDIPTILENSVVKKVNPGFLRKYKLIASVADKDHPEHTKILKHHKKKNKIKLSESLLDTDTLDEIYKEINTELDNGSFMVWKYKKKHLSMNGLLIVGTTKSEQKAFFYINKKRLKGFSKTIIKRAIDILKKSNFGNEDQLYKEIMNLYDKSIFIKLGQ